jgi:alcohol dehydrogenase (cytochrome c)
MMGSGAGKQAWSIPEKFMILSGALTTASDLVFYGTVDGWFRAVDARNGEVLWSQKLGSGIISQPITYTGPDAEQYVAVYTGVGGAAMVSSDEPGFPPRGNTLYVFALAKGNLHGGAGMRTTAAKAAAARLDANHNSR